MNSAVFRSSLPRQIDLDGDRGWALPFLVINLYATPNVYLLAQMEFDDCQTGSWTALATH